MNTGIVILNYNGFQDTIQCVESIVAHNSTPIKFIIVDNGSTAENEVPNLDNYFCKRFSGRYLMTTSPNGVLPYITFIPNSNNVGYAKGNNIGLHTAFSDSEITHVLILNNDVILTEDIIPTLEKRGQELPHCGIVSPLLYHKDRKSLEYNCARIAPSNFSVMLPFLFHNRDLFHILSSQNKKRSILRNTPELIQASSFPIDLPSGSCMFADKKVFMNISGFDPHTFLYYEENILYKKLRAHGYINYCIPTVSAIHLGGNSTSKTANEFLQKCNAESADHYLRNYCDMTLPEKWVWSFTKWAYMFRLKVKELFRK